MTPTFDIRWIDVSENLQNRQQPVFMAGRTASGNPSDAKEGVFWVPQTPVLGGGEIEWAVTRAGEHVRIPINAYMTPQPAMASLLAVGMEAGVRAALSLKQNQPPANVIQVRLVVGHEVHEADGGGWRCYLGMSLRTE